MNKSRVRDSKQGANYYVNMPMQYTANSYSCKNDNFRI